MEKAAMSGRTEMEQGIFRFDSLRDPFRVSRPESMFRGGLKMPGGHLLLPMAVPSQGEFFHRLQRIPC